jgi:hypothetical protein
MKLSAFIPLLIFLPNIILIFASPKSESIPEKNTKTILYRLVEIVEWLSRIAVLIIPFYCMVYIQTKFEFACLGIMTLAMLFYYLGWLRYILKGRDYRLLYANYLGIPLPMAVWPIIYFLLSAIILHSPLMALASLIFGISHISISVFERTRLSNSKSPDSMAISS